MVFDLPRAPHFQTGLFVEFTVPGTLFTGFSVSVFSSSFYSPSSAAKKSKSLTAGRSLAGTSNLTHFPPIFICGILDHDAVTILALNHPRPLETSCSPPSSITRDQLCVRPERKKLFSFLLMSDSLSSF